MSSEVRLVHYVNVPITLHRSWVADARRELTGCMSSRFSIILLLYCSLSLGET